MITPAPIISEIAARVGPGHGLGPDVAKSIVRNVLEIYTTEYTASNATEDANEEKGT